MFGGRVGIWQRLGQLLLLGGCCAITGLWNVASSAGESQRLENRQLQPDDVPLDIDVIQLGNIPPSVITETMVSQTTLTIPSLWWVRDYLTAKKDFDKKLIKHWLAYQHVGRIDFVVDPQRWSFLDYIHRYEFLNQFGETARNYGYNIRVFDSRARLLGAYTCDFSSLSEQRGHHTTAVQPAAIPQQSVVSNNRLPSSQSRHSVRCNVKLDFGGKGSVGGGVIDPFGITY